MKKLLNKIFGFRYVQVRNAVDQISIFRVKELDSIGLYITTTGGVDQALVKDGTFDCYSKYGGSAVKWRPYIGEIEYNGNNKIETAEYLIKNCKTEEELNNLRL